MMDPRWPDTFPKRVFVSTLGLAPQVLTETVYALGVEQERPFVPTEIHVVTTLEGARLAKENLLGKYGGQLYELERQYGLSGLASSLPKENLHVIPSQDEVGLEDINSLEDNTAAADVITGLVRKLANDQDSALHCSIAGGRKTMGFLMGYALSLFARPQDRLSHVLVRSPFQENREFYFPPKTPQIIEGRNGEKVSTGDAQILLAEIPVVRMRDNLPEWLKSGELSYSDTVRLAQQALIPPKMIFRVADSVVEIGDKKIRMPPQRFAIGLWLAKRWLEAKCGGKNDWVDYSLKWDSEDWMEMIELYTKIPEVNLEYARKMKDRFTKDSKTETDDKKAYYSEQLSRFRSSLSKGAGPVAKTFTPVRRRCENKEYRTGFDVSSAAIEIDWGE